MRKKLTIVFLAACWVFFMIRIVLAQTATPPILGIAWYDVDGDLAYRPVDQPADHVQVTVTVASQVYTLTTDSNGWFGYTASGEPVDTATQCPATFKPWAIMSCSAVGVPNNPRFWISFSAPLLTNRIFIPLVHK